MPSQIKVDEIKNVAGQYKIKTDTFEGQTTAGSITVQGEGTATTNLQQGLAKAWGAVTNAAGVTNTLNFASGTDHGTGDFSYTLTNAYANVNHVMASSASSANPNVFVHLVFLDLPKCLWLQRSGHVACHAFGLLESGFRSR